MNLPKIFDVSKTIPDLHTNISRKFLMPEKIGKTLLYNSKTKLYSGVALIMRFMWHAISREEITDITLGDWLENEKLFKAKFFNHTSIKILNSHFNSFDRYNTRKADFINYIKDNKIKYIDNKDLTFAPIKVPSRLIAGAYADKNGKCCSVGAILKSIYPIKHDGLRNALDFDSNEYSKALDQYSLFIDKYGIEENIVNMNDLSKNSNERREKLINLFKKYNIPYEA